jgi:hypothetical protein
MQQRPQRAFRKPLERAQDGSGSMATDVFFPAQDEQHLKRPERRNRQEPQPWIENLGEQTLLAPGEFHPVDDLQAESDTKIMGWTSRTT